MSPCTHTERDCFGAAPRPSFARSDVEFYGLARDLGRRRSSDAHPFRHHLQDLEFAGRQRRRAYRGRPLQRIGMERDEAGSRGRERGSGSRPMRRLEARRGRPTGEPGLSRRSPDPTRGARRPRRSGARGARRALAPPRPTAAPARRPRERDRRDAGPGRRGRSGWSRAIRIGSAASPRCAPRRARCRRPRGPRSRAGAPPRSPPSGLNEAGDHAHRHREGQGAGGSRVHADDAPGRIGERAAGVARCQTQIRLDPRASVPLDGADCAHDSGAQGPADAERMADGGDERPDSDRVRPRESRPASPFPGR